MSYEDVDEIKKQLHDAYMEACIHFVKSQSPSNFTSFEAKAIETKHLIFSVKIETKKDNYSVEEGLE